MNVQDKLTKLKNLYETYKEEFFTITDERPANRTTSSVTPTLLRMARIIVENGKSLKDFEKGENPATITLTDILQFSSSGAGKLMLYINRGNLLSVEMSLQRETIKLNDGVTLFFLESITLKENSKKVEELKVIELCTMDIALSYAFNELYNALFNELPNAPLRRG
nr:MAG TPA: hypothetical protein [Caudoviricetes sp.]